MRWAPMLLVTGLCAVPAGCVDAASGGAVAAAPVHGSQETLLPLVPIDQPSPPGPPGSRERSPVLDQALSAHSSAALIMFLLRHPGDPFAEQARTYLKARRVPDDPEALRAAAGSESGVVAAFDTARLAGTDAAWAEFLARHGDHPLAAEVPRFR